MLSEHTTILYVRNNDELLPPAPTFLRLPLWFRLLWWILSKYNIGQGNNLEKQTFTAKKKKKITRSVTIYPQKWNRKPFLKSFGWMRGREKSVKKPTLQSLRLPMCASQPGISTFITADICREPFMRQILLAMFMTTSIRSQDFSNLHLILCY